MGKLIIKNGKIVRDAEGIVMNNIANVASGDFSLAEGENTTASGDFSRSEGQGTTASGDFSRSEGQGTTASGELSYAAGLGAISPNVNEWSRAYFFSIGNYGLGQYGYVNWVGTSTSNLLNQELFLDGGAARFSIPNNSVFGFEATMVAVNVATGAAKMSTAVGLVKNIGGTTSIVGSPTFTNIAADASMTGVYFNMLINNTNDTIYAAVSGIAATTIRYNVSFKYTALK